MLWEKAMKRRAGIGRRRVARALGAAVLVAALAGCPDSIHDGTFVITNAAPGVLVTELYLVPTGSVEWGANLMTVPIAYGQSFLVSDLEPGNYDEMAVAIYLDTNETDRLVNEAIRIERGRTFTHLVQFAPPWP